MALNNEDIFRISFLIFKYCEKTLDPTEELELNQWLSSDVNVKEIFDQLNTPQYLRSELELMNQFDSEVSLRHFHDRHVPPKEIGWFSRNSIGVAAAAIIIMIIGVSLFYFNQQPIVPAQNFSLTDIGPAKNSATLTLANGKRIKLNSARNGELVTEAGVKITKTKEGQIIYLVEDKNEKNISSNQYNVLSTAYGETFQVHLPDGSKVWLNAGSSLKYPTSFAGIPKRKVELNGEAYFEISKDKSHPFVVTSVGQEVEVLGTHFNINAYENESSVKTTLIEGSVEVNGRFRLKPDQQSIVSSDGIKVIPVIAESFIDWKEGVFNFEDEDLYSVMRKLSRWYNVEVIYRGKPDDKQTFSGYISRSSNVSLVLQKLSEISSLEFKINDKTIFVSK